MPRGVASVITVFVDGRAVKMDAGRTSHHSEWREVRAGETFQLVVAYKLVSISNLVGMSWKDFIISAEAADINHFLNKEANRFKTESTICDLGLTSVDTKEVEMIPTAASESSGTTGTTAQEHQTKWHGSIALPNSIPEDSGADLKPYLEYLAWRHLEYILSACTVPFCVGKNVEGREYLYPFTDKQDGGRKEEFKYQDLPYVALTCGDMSGHRVVTSTSYFAFVFLIRMARRLKLCQKQLKEELPYISDLRKRIGTVCRGHMRWLQRLRMIEHSEKGSEHIKMDFKAGSEEETSSSRLLYSGCFAANYLVTGKMILRRGETWQPPNMNTDTAFQILKMTEMYNHLDQDDKTLDTENKDEVTPHENAEDRREILRMIEDTYVPWLFKLDRIDHQENFAWPHGVTEGFNKFRLDDHFWIWKALKSLERSKVTSRYLQASKSRLSKEARADTDDTGWNELERQWIKFLSKPEDEKEKFKLILDRLEASNVQRRVLQRFTTENSVSKRRMLALTRSPRESRYIFHARDMALFYDQDSASFLAGSTNKQLWLRTIDAQPYHEGNQFTNWDNTMRYALCIAMGINGKTLNETSPDDLVTKSTIVLLNCSGFNGIFPGFLDAGTKEPSLFETESDRDCYYHATFEINLFLLENALEINRHFHRGDASLQGTDSATASTDAPAEKKSPSAEETLSSLLRKIEAMTARPEIERKAKMEKSIPSSHALDSSKIMLIDEEWLYNYPEFLLGSEIGDVDIENSRMLLKNGKISARDAEARPIVAFVVDVSKQKHHGKRHDNEPPKPEPFETNSALLEYLTSPRTSVKAKKRLIWLAHANKETEVNCLAAIPNMGQLALSDFFERHDQYTKDIWDHVNLVLNVWQTNVHLSFYVLTKRRETPADGPPRRNMVAIPRNSKMAIERTSMSFHFSGDSFDRYWTCHIVDNINEDNTGLSSSPADCSELSDFNKKSSLQRKVLELRLLGRILDLSVIHVKRILGEVQKQLDIEENGSLLSQLDRISDLRSTDDWHLFEHLLQMLEEDLATTIEVLMRWDNRAEARGKQQPRWTHNDEKKYRGDLTEAQAINDRHSREIHACREQILKLKDDLSRSRQTRRDDLEFYGNQSIRYFTYVTIIFLPLGFATSVYSMNGPPDSSFLTSLIKFIVAAFAVTFVLLVIAESFMKFANDLLKPVKNALRTGFQTALEPVKDALRPVKHSLRGTTKTATGIFASSVAFMASCFKILVGILTILADVLKQAMRPRKVVQVLAAFHYSEDNKISPQILAWLVEMLESLVLHPNTEAATGSNIQQDDPKIEGWYKKITKVPSSLRPFSKDDEVESAM
ncbi:hypothetical protein SLS63_008576 [Diaporthe eres]|uniref:Uncharacterized protein n=1 Tax=Diaporthe eres TaxID=83184 RepID=A0ABR1P234_DIAER